MKTIKKLLIVALFLSPAVLNAAEDIRMKLRIETTDGAVSTIPTKLLVTTGTLTINGDGTATLNTGGSGGVGGGFANPATENLDMNGYQIIDAGQYTTSGSSESVISSTFSRIQLYVNSSTSNIKSGDNPVNISSYTFIQEFQTVTSDTSTSVLANNVAMPGIGYSVLAGSTYYVDAFVYFVDAATTTGLSLMLDGPAGSTVAYSGWSPVAQTNPGTDNLGENSCTVWLCKVTSANSLTPAISPSFNTMHLEGFVAIGADGTLSLKFTTEANGSSVTIRRGSLVRYWKVR